MVNSRGLLTGCLNLIMDKAPTIPRDNAMLPEITCVITKPIKGNKQYVIILEKDFAQYWPDKFNEKLTNDPNNTSRKHLEIKSKSINTLFNLVLI